MLKITADTNTLISAAIAKGNEFELLKLVRDGKIKLILSPYILQEFKEVISRAKFGFSEEQINNAVKQMINICEIIMPLSKIGIIRDDPQDNMILECAETGYADYIVSGDEHLLSIKEYKGIKILKSGEILKLIERN